MLERISSGSGMAEADKDFGRPLTRREAIKANEARDLLKIIHGNRNALEYALRDGKASSTIFLNQIDLLSMGS